MAYFFPDVQRRARSPDVDEYEDDDKENQPDLGIGGLFLHDRAPHIATPLVTPQTTHPSPPWFLVAAHGTPRGDMSATPSLALASTGPSTGSIPIDSPTFSRSTNVPSTHWHAVAQRRRSAPDRQGHQHAANARLNDMPVPRPPQPVAQHVPVPIAQFEPPAPDTVQMPYRFGHLGNNVPQLPGRNTPPHPVLRRNTLPDLTVPHRRASLAVDARPPLPRGAPRRASVAALPRRASIPSIPRRRASVASVPPTYIPRAMSVPGPERRKRRFATDGAIRPYPQYTFPGTATDSPTTNQSPLNNTEWGVPLNNTEWRVPLNITGYSAAQSLLCEFEFVPLPTTLVTVPSQESSASIPRSFSLPTLRDPQI